MARGAFTLRIDTDERVALETLSKIEKRPMNQLVNEAIKAIKAYLNRRGEKERSLETSLERLRAYRRRDPGFKKAIAAFVEAEATLQDPLEGEPIKGRVVDGRLEPVGPVQSRIRELLGA